MKCTNPNCKYEWAPKVKKPISCPKCRQYIKYTKKSPNKLI